MSCAGEELQLLGLQRQIQYESIVVLLGTHSKHVHVSHQDIFSFQTFLTGELFMPSFKNILSLRALWRRIKRILSGVQKSKWNFAL